MSRKSVGELGRILEAGGSIEVDGSELSCSNLEWLAKAAKKGGGMLIVRNAGVLSTSNLCRIAEAGKGHVIFKDLDVKRKPHF